MTEQKTYKGNCHCGAVACEADMALDGVVACNCSICKRRGYLLGFIPAADFRLLQGRDVLTDYQFGKKSIHHLFCKICGVSLFSEGVMPDGSEIRAINLRCFDDIDIEALPVQNYDGASI